MDWMSISALLGTGIAVFSMKINPKNEMLWGFGESLEGVSITRQMYALIMPGLASIFVRCVPTVAGRSPAVRTSHLLATINALVAITYKPESRTENPCVGGSR